MLWTACLILLRHLETASPRGWWQGKRVLELGSGSGHLAVGLSKLGASVVATESSIAQAGAGYTAMVAWTTYLQQQRASDAGFDGGSVEFRGLHWATDVDPSLWQGFDVVVLSELYYDPEMHEVLLHTLRSVLTPGAVAYSIFCDRPFSMEFLMRLDDDGSFEVEPIEPAEVFSLHEDEELLTHKITRRTVTQATEPAWPGEG